MIIMKPPTSVVLDKLCPVRNISECVTKKIVRSAATDDSTREVRDIKIEERSAKYSV